MSVGAINKVCVIGSGTMGAGIAAQVANAGIPVLLLDIVRDEADRNGVARAAVERMLQTEPAPFMSTAAAKLIETGNIDDDIGRVAECDWVIEAIVERLDLKQALYARIEAAKRPGTAVSSNTSTIPLARLVEGRGEQFRRDFLITHFFNPPRYMRLLEVVAGPGSDPALVARVSDFADRMMGKTVIPANDSPGFIANRLGVYWLAVAVNAAMDQGLTIEEADQIGGRPMGVPGTGVFGLIDLVGVDLMPLLSASLQGSLKPADPYFATVRPQPLIEKMIADGYTGRKGKGGFYRMDRSGGARIRQSLDLTTGEYRAERKPRPLPPEAERDLGALIAAPGKVGSYAWAVLGNVLSYAAMLVPEAAADIVAVDEAMKLGYNWKAGPFEMIDRLGAAELVARLEAEGRPVPEMLRSIGGGRFYRREGGTRQFFGTDGRYHDIAPPPGVLALDDIKRNGRPLIRNASAALWDIGDGVAALEFTARMNALDGEVMKLIAQAVPLVSERFKALVIYNDGANFSAGANLGLVMFAVNIAAWGELEMQIAAGQQAYKALKYAPFPVVAAPAGMALGGGCEILLHADAVQAHAESYIGLVEVGVGLVPAGGGCGEVLDRWSKSARLPKGPMPAVAKVFELVGAATVSKSAADAQELLYLRPGDAVTMNRARLLYDAKEKALALAEGYSPPAPPEHRLPGPAGRTALGIAAQALRARGLATDYDVVVLDALAEVLTGGDADLIDTVSEAEMLRLEREAFMARVRDRRTLARVEHMLDTGKPLRN